MRAYMEKDMDDEKYQIASLVTVLSDYSVNQIIAVCGTAIQAKQEQPQTSKDIYNIFWSHLEDLRQKKEQNTIQRVFSKFKNMWGEYHDTKDN